MDRNMVAFIIWNIHQMGKHFIQCEMSIRFLSLKIECNKYFTSIFIIRTLLIAACEKKSIVLFDPITNRQTKAVKNAHLDSVNCVKYVQSFDSKDMYLFNDHANKTQMR